MKVTGVHLFASPNPEPLVLSFRDPSAKNKFLARAIVGLDADDLMRQFYSNGGNNIGKMNDITLSKRSVTIRMGLNPNFSENESYSDLRDHVYKFIQSSRTGRIVIHFINGANAVAGLTGYISKVETPHSSKDSEIQITIDCENPMLEALSRTTVNISGLNPSSTTIVDNESTAPHGMLFRISFLGTVPTFSITDTSTGGKAFSVSGSSLDGFKVGDVVHFCSERGNKYFYVVRSGVTYHLIDKLNPGSVWPIMFPGSNTYTGVANMKWEHISYMKTFWGI